MEKVLTRHEIAKLLSEKLKGQTSKRIPMNDIKIILRTLPEIISESVLAGSKVRLSGLGDFFGVVKPAGEGRDPRTGEPIALEERMITKFKMSRTLKENVKAAFKEAVDALPEEEVEE